QRLTEWASTTESGDRDDLKPGVADRSWGQVSVSARECLGMARCPFGTDCFAERARAHAGGADVVVTNHSLLAINAVADSAVLPEHRLLVVDEATGARAEAVASLAEIADTATRILASFGPAIPERTDVVWLDHEDNRGSTRSVLRVAPLSVAGLLRSRLFADSTAVLTSATLTVGGSFDAMAKAWGLADTEIRWRGIDVGSPFEHGKAGILY